MNKKELGNYIKTRRTKLNITQNDIAIYFNISTQAVSKWENGSSYPDFILLGDLASLLKVSIDDLLTLNTPLVLYKNTYKFNYQTFGETINKYLSFHNLTQKEFSKLTNISQATISSIINDRSFPSIEQFMTIANIFNISYSDLYYSIYKEKEVITIENNHKINKNLVIKLGSILCISLLVIFTSIGIINNNNNSDNINNSNTNSNNILLAKNKNYNYIEFWDENNNLIDAQKIIKDKKIQYYPEIYPVMGWDKVIDTSITSSIYRMNKNPYKYYFFIETSDDLFRYGYNDINYFSNFDFKNNNNYLKNTIKDYYNNEINIHDLAPGVYTFYGEETPIKEHYIYFQGENKIDPIKIRDAELIKELPSFFYEDYIIKDYEYFSKKIEVGSRYTYEKSIEVYPIHHNQKTIINENGYITYLSSNEEEIIIPDNINNIKVKGINSNAIYINDINNKLVFLNKDELNCKDIFSNKSLINNIKEIEVNYNFISNDSYLDNISNIDKIILKQELQYHDYHNQYRLTNLSSNNNFHINELHYDDEACELFSFENLNVNDVYYSSKAMYGNIGIPYMFKDSQIKTFNLSSNFIENCTLDFYEGAFYNCKNLKEFNFPCSVDFHGDKVFYGCENLENVTFYGNAYSNINKLTNEMFSGTKIKYLKINNIELIKENAFKGSNIEEIDIVKVNHVENNCYLPSSLKDFYLGGNFIEAIKFINTTNKTNIHYIDYKSIDNNFKSKIEYNICVDCICRHKGEQDDYWTID